MNSVPDRPFATLDDSILAARIFQNRLDQESLSHDRSGAAKRVLVQLRRTYAELIAERDHRDWLKFDESFPIPKIDPQPPILTGESRVHEGGVGVCAEGRS